jgi:hypothetical protein
VQRGQRTGGRNLEHCTSTGPAARGGSVEVPIRSLYQASDWAGTVGAVRSSAKVVKSGQDACWGDFENRAPVLVTSYPERRP